jgi:hypothetical protein
VQTGIQLERLGGGGAAELFPGYFAYVHRCDAAGWRVKVM